MAGFLRIELGPTRTVTGLSEDDGAKPEIRQEIVVRQMSRCRDSAGVMVESPLDGI
jgi:hypothetical protein